MILPIEYTKETNDCLDKSGFIVNDTMRKVLKIMYDDGFIIRCGYIPVYKINEYGFIILE